MQDLMLRTTGAVHIPKSLTSKILYPSVVGRFFKSDFHFLQLLGNQIADGGDGKGFGCDDEFEGDHAG